MVNTASRATQTAMIATYSGCEAHSIHTDTGLRNASVAATNTTELPVSDIRAVEYTSMGSFHRSWLAKRKKPVSMP